jgi:hypothetical protein
MAGQASAEDLAKIREAVDSIRDRLATDPQLVQQLIQSPRQTLEQEGVPSDAVNTVLSGGAAQGLEAAGCWFSIGCVTTRCCFSISVCCGTGSC